MGHAMTENIPRDLSRRNFIKGVVAAGAVASSSAYLFRTTTLHGQPAGAGAVERLVTLNINGQKRRVDVMKQETLAMTLRYSLGLTGTKIGCDRAECGACTVLIDDLPHYSCSYLAQRARGKKIVTIEGLADPATGKLSAVQQGVIDEQGFQCAFCMPGFVMAATGYLKTNPNPTRQELAHGVSGKAKYAEDYRVEGMLFAKLLVSPYPHARVKRCDTSAAMAMPGVKAILRAEEMPGAAAGATLGEGVQASAQAERGLTDEPLYYGEPVLAVAAIDEATAAEAIEKIDIEFEPLPFVVDPIESLRPNGPNARTQGNVWVRPTAPPAAPGARGPANSAAGANAAAPRTPRLAAAPVSRPKVSGAAAPKARRQRADAVDADAAVQPAQARPRLRRSP